MGYGEVRCEYGTVTVRVRYGDANGLNSLEILYYFQKARYGSSVKVYANKSDLRFIISKDSGCITFY